MKSTKTAPPFLPLRQESRAQSRSAYFASIYLLSLLLGLLTLSSCAKPIKPVTGIAPADDSTSYLIGPGDVLQIFIWRNPELSVTIPVRPDGKISTPLVEDIPAVGKTPTQLARDIETILADVVKSPKVNVIVTNFIGQFSRQIRVLGQATNPRALSFREQITLLDVMIEVGGLTEFAAGNRAKIVRTEGEQVREIRVRLDDLIADGDISANVLMSPGDVLIIPESFF